MTEHSEIPRLIERSSLGTSAARKLRDRTSPGQAREILELERLTAEVERGEWAALIPLAHIHERRGNVAAAEACYTTVAALALRSVSSLEADAGRADMAEMWERRARTLDDTGSTPSQASVCWALASKMYENSREALRTLLKTPIGLDPQVMAVIPPREMEVVRLVVIDGMTTHDAATALNLSP